MDKVEVDSSGWAIKRQKCFACKKTIADDHLAGMNKSKNGKTIYFCDKEDCVKQFDSGITDKQDRKLVQAALGELMDMQQELPKMSPGDDPHRLIIKRPKLNIVYIKHEKPDA